MKKFHCVCGALTCCAPFGSDTAIGILAVSLELHGEDHGRLFVRVPGRNSLRSSGVAPPLIETLLEPVIQLAKSVPVASLVVLLLIFMGSENLSIVLVFLMAFPMIYVNMGQGLAHVDTKLLEMAQVFT